MLIWKRQKITEYFIDVEMTEEHKGYFCSVEETLAMSESTKGENAFIAYEYKNITIRCSTEALYADNYESFG